MAIGPPNNSATANPMVEKLSSQNGVLRHVSWDHFVAGISGGVLSTLLLHPFDLFKVRFQVNEGHAKDRPQYKGLLDACQQIVKKDGFTGLYRGVVPNVMGSGFSWGFYFFVFNGVKSWMQDGDSRVALGPSQHMMAAAQAGVVTLALTNPIWVVKTRLILQYDRPANTLGDKPNVYKGVRDALVKIYKHEGMRGLYKGFIPGMLGVSHGALQFMAYEQMKNSYNVYKKRSIDFRLASWEYILFAALSKMFAAFLTYPYQVVRSRLQEQHRSYNGSIEVIRKTFQREGWKGFYKGLVPNLLRVTPACCITFVVYENIMSYSLKHRVRQPD